MKVSQARSILPAGIDKQKALEVYRKIAPRYDLWARLTESKARARCLELAAIQDGEAVLEVAVGTGLAFAELLKSNPSGRNEGLDLSPEMLSQAVERAERSGVESFRLTVGDAYDLQYPDGTFDVVINNYMFDLLPEEDFLLVLAEFGRVMRPGGRLVMVNMTVSERWYGRAWEGIYRIIYRINPAWMGGCRGVYLLPYLESIGFENTRREFISQLTFPSEVIFGVKRGSHASSINNR
jgi:ubiquinone/menaquinone biosynthesis C-methylase UbiE